MLTLIASLLSIGSLSVQEWGYIAAKARRTCQKVHVGQVFGICVEKGHELLSGSKGRRHKGRYVYQGNDVKDERGNFAVFQELSSNPATMQAVKTVSAYGCLPGNKAEQRDAEQSYVQSDFDHSFAETWARIPREYWPRKWIELGLKDAVVRLRKALYGHPDAGGLWERHCEAHLRTVGFTPIENWLSTYWHKDLQLLLVVYVDNFAMSGPSQNLENHLEGRWR